MKEAPNVSAGTNAAVRSVDHEQVGDVQTERSVPQAAPAAHAAAGKAHAEATTTHVRRPAEPTSELHLSKPDNQRRLR